MAKLFRIEGYWKDDYTHIGSALVYEYDECPEWLNDDEIFFFGLSESDIIDLIHDGEGSPHEFVIDSYECVDEYEIPERIVSEIMEMVSSTPNDYKLGEQIRTYINKLEE